MDSLPRLHQENISPVPPETPKNHTYLFPSEVVPQFRKLHRTLRYKDKMRADFGTTQPKTPNSYCAPQHCLMIKIALLCNVQCLSADIQLCSKLEATQGIPWTCDQRRQPSSKNETPKKSIQKVFLKKTYYKKMPTKNAATGAFLNTKIVTLELC